MRKAKRLMGRLSKVVPAVVAVGLAASTRAVGTADATITAALDNAKATFDYGTPIAIGAIVVGIGFGYLKFFGKKK